MPKNVYIIGTMNTADRSIALIDIALRRRFGFVELLPDIRILGDTVIEGIPLGPWLFAVNSKIREFIGRDARNLQIGHAYFLENGKPINSFSKLARILRDDILPLVQEYCYEDYDTITKILGKAFIDSKSGGIDFDIFSSDRKDDLISALKAIEPELASSAPVIKSEEEHHEAEESEDEPSETDVSSKNSQ